MKRMIGPAALIAAMGMIFYWLSQDDPGPESEPIAESRTRAARDNADPLGFGSSSGSSSRRESAQAQPSKASSDPTQTDERIDPGSHSAHGHDTRARERGSELSDWLNENPLSDAPHEVLEAWGGPPGSDGPIGLSIIVSPDMPIGELEQLVDDLRQEYQSAQLLSTKIYDSEEAATYDRHTDGGARAARHLVAHVVRDEGQGIETVKIHGQQLEP